MKPLERDAAYLWDMLDAAKQAAVLSDGIGLDGLLDDVRTRYAIERRWRSSVRRRDGFLAKRPKRIQRSHGRESSDSATFSRMNTVQ